jgi:hypothetical protein
MFVYMYQSGEFVLVLTDCSPGSVLFGLFTGLAGRSIECAADTLAGGSNSPYPVKVVDSERLFWAGFLGYNTTTSNHT